MLNLSEGEMVIHILFLVCLNLAIIKKVFKKSWKRKKMLLKSHCSCGAYILMRKQSSQWLAHCRPSFLPTLLCKIQLPSHQQNFLPDVKWGTTHSENLWSDPYLSGFFPSLISQHVIPNVKTLILIKFWKLLSQLDDNSQN